MNPVASPRSSRSPAWGLGLLALALAAGTASPARADNIDEKLLQESRTLIKKLQGYDNVGVLKFRVQLGDKAPTFNAGLMNSSLAIRLENALILANGKDGKPIGITRNASQVAADKDRKATYLGDAGKKLFDHKYPLAWGSEQVSVDAFLTGLVKIDPNMRKTTVVIQAFDRKAPALREVTQFTVPTDRSILTDAGQSFYLTQRALTLSGDEQDEESAQNAQNLNQGGSKPATPPEAVLSLLDFEIWSGGSRVNLVGDPASGGEILTEANLQEGQKVYFTVRNKTSAPLGVVVLVNGINTLHKERNLTKEEFWKWVLVEPNKPYTIDGFFLERGGKEEFEVMSVDRLRQLGELDENKLGQIELLVFRPGGANAEDIALKARKVNLRALSQLKDRPRTLGDAQKQIHQFASTPKPIRKGVIGPGRVGEATVLETEFKNPVLAGGLIINYYKP